MIHFMQPRISRIFGEGRFCGDHLSKSHTRKEVLREGSASSILIICHLSKLTCHRR